jgi:hypothetical protein
MKENYVPVPRFQINCWFGRLGNNLQQVLLAIAHAQFFGGKFTLSKEFLSSSDLALILDPFDIVFDKAIGHNNDAVYKNHNADIISNFFFYKRRSYLRRYASYLLNKTPHSDCLDSWLEPSFFERNAFHLAQRYVRPHLKNKSFLLLSNDSIVIHLRSDDIRSLDNTYYLQHPLYFYRNLARLYSNAIIITEPDLSHPLLHAISREFESCQIKSESIHSDFHTLLSAKAIAISGVSTFALAAALLSSRLEVLHTSSACIARHLNPSMLKHTHITLKTQHLYFFRLLWRFSGNRTKLLSIYNPLRPWNFLN